MRVFGSVLTQDFQGGEYTGMAILSIVIIPVFGMYNVSRSSTAFSLVEIPLGVPMLAVHPLVLDWTDG
jgi:hypothetical protein